MRHGRKIIEMKTPIDYKKMTEIIEEFTEKYEFLSIGNLGFFLECEEFYV